MQSLHEKWLATSYKRQLILLFLFGAVMVAAMPPLFIVPALIPGLVALFWSLEGLSLPQNFSLKRGFFYGWALGFGYFVAGLYWLGFAIAVDLATFWWAMPFALFGLQSLLAIFFGLTTLSTVWTMRRFKLSGWSLVWMLAFFWLCADLLRSVVFTGFPWNLLGTSLGLHPIFIQFAAFGGVHFLTLIVLVWAVTPALIVKGSTRNTQRLTGFASFILIPLIVFGYGFYRLDKLGALAQETHPNIQLRLVQANIAQSLKWDPELSRANLQKHVDLSILPANGGAKPNIIIWPETAVPFALNRSVKAQKSLATSVLGPNLLSQYGNKAILITGANRVERGENTVQAWNHMYVLNQAGKLIEGYDKHHLVPFGEYIPYRGVFNVAKITQGTIDFSASSGPKTIELEGVPAFSPMICYEGIFTSNIINTVVATASRPQWLLSITNDGWFGISSGPYQHLVATMLRSVEEGLPLVRVSNPGVSIITDALGQTIQKTKLGEAGILDSRLPVSLQNRPLYSIFGLKIVYLMMPILMICGLAPFSFCKRAVSSLKFNRLV